MIAALLFFYLIFIYTLCLIRQRNGIPGLRPLSLITYKTLLCPSVQFSVSKQCFSPLFFFFRHSIPIYASELYFFVAFLHLYCTFFIPFMILFSLLSFSVRVLASSIMKQSITYFLPLFSSLSALNPHRVQISFLPFSLTLSFMLSDINSFIFISSVLLLFYTSVF